MNSGIQSLATYKASVGVTSLPVKQFEKSGRKFLEAPDGTPIMFSKDLDLTQPLYVSVADASIVSATGESLEGTMWLVNAAVADTGETL